MRTRLLKLILPFIDLPLAGALFFRLAWRLSGTYKARLRLVNLTGKRIVSPRADIHCPQLHIGEQTFVDDHVTIYTHRHGGGLRVGPHCSIQRYTVIEMARGGSVSIGENSHIQPGCHLTAALGSIVIGNDVQLAPRCALYPYQHGYEDPDMAIRLQPITSKGDIVIEDDVWLGVGVIVMDGVTIGRGAVVGAGAVVTEDIPPYAIAVGVPARVTGWRRTGE